MKHIKVAKISLSINTEKSAGSKKEIYQYFRVLNNELMVASNKLLSYYWMRYQTIDSLLLEEKTKLGLLNKKTNEPLIGKSLFDTYNKHDKGFKPYQMTLSYFNKPGLSFIGASLSLNIINKFRNDLNDIVKGKKSLPNFKLGLPIPMNFSKTSPKLKPDYTFNFNSDIWFDLYFGKDRSNNKSVVDKIYSGEYDLCDSSIQFKDGKFTFLMVYKFEKNNNVLLDKNIIVGVDLGITNSAVLTLNEGYPREYISLQGQIDSLRNNIRRRKWRLSKELKNISGGKGRNKKLKTLYDIGEKESNSVKNINHLISKSIVQFALKNNAGIIKLENLTGISTSNKFLKSWTYFQLQTMIEYKAKENNIDVLYINPRYTSQTCSKCGNLEEGQRETQAEFKCKSCGHEENADLNAARNIAKSDKIVKDKSFELNETEELVLI